MKISLSTGTATLRIRIAPATANRRQVWVTLTLPDDTALAGMSACAPGDRFTRFTGKKLAFERLLFSTANGWRGGWAQIGPPNDPHRRQFVPLPLADKADRGRLWAAVLGPRYGLARWTWWGAEYAVNEPVAVGWF